MDLKDFAVVIGIRGTVSAYYAIIVFAFGANYQGMSFI